MDFRRETNKLIRAAHAILRALFSAALDQAAFSLSLGFASSRSTLYAHTPSAPFKTQFHLQAAAGAKEYHYPQVRVSARNLILFGGAWASCAFGDS